MANYYSQGATCLNKDNVPGLHKILKSWKMLTKAFDRADESGEINYPYEAPGDGSDFGYSGLEIMDDGEGNLYISSGDESMNDGLFINFIGTCLKAGWITGGSVGISIAFFCDKLRSNEHGGYHLRVLPDGSSVAVGTGHLEMLSDGQLADICAMR